MASLSHSDYTVGWICALPLETAAAKAMLDEVHAKLPQPPHDHNSYTLGKVSGHNVVIACLPSGIYGTTSAATGTTQMLSTFPAIRFGLVVGIGGGVPSEIADIRLGDVVVSKPTSTFGGVIQYDYGKMISGGSFERTGALNKPPAAILTAVADLQSDHMMGISQIPQFLSDMIAKYPAMTQFTYQGQVKDELFQAEYDHVGLRATCRDCDINRLIKRRNRASTYPHIHYGSIASGNQVIRHGGTRDQLAQELRILCFEMEAAGLMDYFPCLVIRGICDYSDSHKNKQWQGYAAATAAAYAKELLSVVSVMHIEETQRACDKLLEAETKFRFPLDMTDVPAVHDFIGRESDLAQLWNILQPERPGMKKMRKVAILHGLGGIGKTQLAIRFARIHKDDFTAILWCNGKDREILMRSLASIHPRLARVELEASSSDSKNEEEVEQRANQVLEWLAMEANSKWLLIFDNIDHYSRSNADNDNAKAYDISACLPSADHGSIIITTRLPQLSELGQSHPVPKLGAEEAVRLLIKRSGYSMDTAGGNTMNRPDICSLASRLDGLPLAIVLAGSYICRTGIGLAKYLQLYSQSWRGLQETAPSHRYYSNGNLTTTWTISFDEIQRRYPPAGKLLLLLAHYDNRDIWFQLIRHGLQGEQVPSWFIEIASSEIRFSRAMRVLLDFSLMDSKGDCGGYLMHPVVQDWCRGYIEDGGQDSMRMIALTSIGLAVPFSDAREYWIAQQRLLPHANQILNLIHNGWRLPQDDKILVVFNNLGTLYRDQAKLAEAEIMYRHLFLTTRTLRPDADPTLTLKLAHNLGNLYRIQGRLKDAEATLQGVLGSYQRMHDRGHTAILDIIHDLGILYLSQGKIERAKEMFKQALTSKEKIFGLDHVSTLDTFWNLGCLLYYEGNMTEAAHTFQRMAIDKKALNSEHTYTPHEITMYLHPDQAEVIKAVAMCWIVLAAYEKILGSNHTSTLSVVNGMAVIFFQNNNFKKAEELYQRAWTGRKKALGLDHIFTLDTMNNLGNVFLHQGKLHEAGEMYRQALAGSEKILGTDHTSTLGTINNMGVLYSHQGKLRDAEEMYKRALAGSKKAVGLDHISTLGAANNLGVHYSRQGKMKTAEVMYQKALTGYGNVLIPDHISTLTTVKNMAVLYRDQGRLEEAEKMYQRVLTGQKKTLGSGHAATLNTVNDLENLYQDQLIVQDAKSISQFALVHRPSLIHST